MSCPRPTRRRIHGIRGWLALAALLGLVAMHGLSMHGAGATETSMVGAHAGHEMSGSLTAAAGDPSPGSRGDPGQGHHHLMLMGLCLAVLAGAATAYALLRRRLRGGWTPRLVSYAAWAAAPAARRFRDPPCLYRLSVQRC
ncbi:MAG: DUF6153 family protein [Nocardioides sp.]